MICYCAGNINTHIKISMQVSRCISGPDSVQHLLLVQVIYSISDAHQLKNCIHALLGGVLEEKRTKQTMPFGAKERKRPSQADYKIAITQYWVVPLRKIGTEKDRPLWS